MPSRPKAAFVALVLSLPCEHEVIVSKQARENRVPIMMSEEEIRAIDDWRFQNRVATRSDAVRRLSQMALAFERYRSEFYNVIASNDQTMMKFMKIMGEVTDYSDVGNVIDDDTGEKFGDIFLSALRGHVNLMMANASLIKGINAFKGDVQEIPEAILNSKKAVELYEQERLKWSAEFQRTPEGDRS